VSQKISELLLARRLSAPIMLALCLLSGCVSQRDVEGPVVDPNFEWMRMGFSVKAPAGSNWYRLAGDENNSSVAFQRGEGLYYAEFSAKNTLYIKGETTIASGTILSEPIKDRSDKNRLVLALRSHLERALLPIKEKVSSAKYDASLGTDCVKYDAISTVERINTEKGDMHIGGIHGFFCLHPDIYYFGVIMQGSNYGTVWTDITKKKAQGPFFESLRFLPISSSALRSLASQRTVQRATKKYGSGTRH
jgi:hypothetical protein